MMIDARDAPLAAQCSNFTKHLIQTIIIITNKSPSLHHSNYNCIQKYKYHHKRNKSKNKKNRKAPP